MTTQQGGARRLIARTDCPTRMAEDVREGAAGDGLRDVFAALVDAELAALGAMLKSKNAAYGNSALDPLRIFSQASPREQLLVRIDDKLSRLKRGGYGGETQGTYAEDVVVDLLGYLVLLRIAERTSNP